LERFPGYQTLPQPLSGSVVTIGNFDGVHRGHQAILAQVIEKAKTLGVPSVAYTFQPHPAKLFRPQLAPPLISTYTQKLDLLESYGIDIAVEQPFTREFAHYSPERFVTSILHETLGAREIFAGFDFSFGKGGKADVQFLRELCEPYGIKLHVIQPLSFESIVASSTKVREFVLAGKVAGAALLLGRPFVLSGHVVQGDQRGRTLGFPTANLDAEQELRPARGVYACYALLQQQRLPAVVNIGMRPTFSTEHVTIEAHLLDFQGDLYGKPLTLEFVEYLRAEKSFDSAELLVEQIDKDIECAKDILIPSGDSH